MKEATVKTSITLEPEVMEMAREKVEDNGQSLSSYVNLLIRRDLKMKRVKTARTNATTSREAA